MTTRYRATLAYDGTAYQGFQRQADAPTIQACVEAALQTVTDQTVTVLGAGRTDAGVHATGQVIAFDVAWRHEPTDLLNALNANLPDDVALQDVAVAAADFHPRFSARARRYDYTVIVAPQRQPLLRGFAWQLRHDLDGEAMQAAADILLGTHDCASLGKPPQGSNTVRTIMQSEWAVVVAEAAPTRWVYTVEANAFLQHMVRRIVGLLVQVGRDLISVDEFADLFYAAELPSGAPLAPPHGLVLTHVRYDEPG